MNEPAWLMEARRHIGEREIKGPQNNPWIVGLWKAIKRGGIKDDETPWCAAFVGGMLEAVGIRSSRFESAKSYLDWGTPLSAPAVGCVVVFTREGGGHVGFVTGEDTRGNLLVLGGNQGDTVSIRAFPRSRVSGYRWPAAVPLIPGNLPLASAETSRTEA